MASTKGKYAAAREAFLLLVPYMGDEEERAIMRQQIETMDDRVLETWIQTDFGMTPDELAAAIRDVEPAIPFILGESGSGGE